MSILIINAGSSSIKYTVYDADTLNAVDHGLIEEISSHREGFEVMRRQLLGHQIDIAQIDAIGHRVVHGGERFKVPTIIDDDLLEELAHLTSLAPLHNPANLEGIRAARTIAPRAIHVAVFDTSFHQSMPEYAYRYPLPHELYTSYHVRRYGFHGTSHYYVAAQAALLLGKPLESLNLITFHIGNGVSACAIEKGRSIDTSMGMTPLEGLMMGSRSGTIDPAIIGYLMREKDLKIEEVETLLNKKSGLLAIAGTNDMRTIIDAADKGDPNALLAIEMFTYRLKKQLGAYMAALNGVDAVIFTGGIGEHSGLIRERMCRNLDHLGIQVDPERNRRGEPMIHHPSASVSLLLIPTNEELQIARFVKELLLQG